jgi:hypothetical protein
MKFLTVLIGLMILISCSDTIGHVDEPADLVARDTMIRVLKELAIMEGYMQNNFIQLSSNQQTIKNTGDAVLKKFNLNFERFERSLNFYCSNQEQMQSIYEEVLDSLQMDLTKTGLNNYPRNRKAISPNIPVGNAPPNPMISK